MTTYELLTTEEVAGELRISVATLKYWRAKGEGPKSFTVGRRVLCHRDDLDAFINQAREQARRERRPA